MHTIEAIALFIIIINIIASYKGFRDPEFFERYIFDVDYILVDKQYYRLLSSAFLHANWFHLILNMAALYSFSESVGYVLGIRNYIAIYLGSLLAGNLLALFIHRNHGDYRAVGASGAISGIIFSSIAIFPDSRISFFFLPVDFAAWMFGIGFVLLSIYGIKSQIGNIGHEAHLGGAIAGVLISIILEPAIFEANKTIILAILFPFCIFMLLIAKRPESLLVDNYVESEFKRITEHQAVFNEIQAENELNRLLEKVSEKGFDSLSKNEKKTLENLSKKVK